MEKNINQGAREAKDWIKSKKWAQKLGNKFGKKGKTEEIAEPN